MKMYIWNIPEDVGGSTFHSTFIILDETEKKAKTQIRKKIKNDIIPKLCSKWYGYAMLKMVTKAKLKEKDLSNPLLYYSEEKF